MRVIHRDKGDEVKDGVVLENREVKVKPKAAVIVEGAERVGIKKTLVVRRLREMTFALNAVPHNALPTHRIRQTSGL